MDGVSAEDVLRIIDRVLARAFEPDEERPYKAVMHVALLFQTLPFPSCPWRNQTDIQEEIESRHGRSLTRQALNKASKVIFRIIQEEAANKTFNRPIRRKDRAVSHPEFPDFKGLMEEARE